MSGMHDKKKPSCPYAKPQKSEIEMSLSLWTFLISQQVKG